MIYSFDLSEKIIAITGGYGHLGEAITRSLLHHNGKVIVLARSEAKFQSVFRDIISSKPLSFIACDISETSSIKGAFTAIAGKFGRLDVLINNAVFTKGQSPEAMEDDAWSYGVDGTLNAVFRLIRESIPYLRNSKGKIINVSSMYGIVSPDFTIYDDHPQFLNPPHYGAAKAAVLQLTRYYASYLGKDGITVNAVTPGPFPSKEVQQNQGFVRALTEKTLLHRIGQPADLGGAFVFLASDAANYITGQNIVVDGGWTAK